MNPKQKLRKKILVIEDDKSLSLILQRELNYMGYEPTGTLDGQSGLEAALSNNFSLIVTDLSLPSMNGISILQKIKSMNIKTPVMIITNYDKDDNEVLSYENGASLFHKKPINFDLFKAQVRMLVESYKFLPTIDIGDIHIDPNKKIFKKDGKLIKLSKKEYAVMLTLASSSGNVFTRKELMSSGNGFNRIYVEESSIDTLISRLRKKLGKYKGSEVIETIYSEGYRLNLNYLE